MTQDTPRRQNSVLLDFHIPPLGATVTSRKRVVETARHLKVDPQWVLIISGGTHMRAGGTRSVVFLEFLPDEDILSIVRDFPGAWNHREHGRWSVPADDLTRVFAKLFPKYQAVVFTDFDQVCKNYDFTPDSRYSPKVFTLLDTSVNASAILADRDLRRHGCSPADMEVHDGVRFVALNSVHAFTRFPFLLLRFHDGDGCRKHAVWSPFARSVMESANAGEPYANRMVATFVQAHRALGRPAVFTPVPEAAEGGGLVDMLLDQFETALRRIHDKLFWPRIGVIPSCWATFSIPQIRDPAQQRIWPDAGTCAWVSRGFPEFYADLNQRVGGLNVDRPVMIAEKVIREQVLTEAGKINTLLHELAHHVHWESEAGPSQDAHHGFWFHVAFLTLLMSVHGRTESVWAYASVSMETYAEDSDRDDPLPGADHAHRVYAAMFAADQVLAGTTRFAGMADVSEIISGLRAFRENPSTDVLRVLRSSRACRQAVLAGDWDEDDPEIQEEFVSARARTPHRQDG